MISKWFEVSIDLFSLIFNEYWDKKGSWVGDNVIEIQNLNSIANGKNGDRIYIGYCIDINDYKDVPSNFLKIETINRLKKYGFKEDTYMSLCILSNSEPDITPILHVDKHRQLILSTCLGEDIDNQLESFIKIPLSSWFVKEKEKYIIGKDKIKDEYPEKDRFIRFRLIKNDHWNKIMSEFIKNQNIEKLHIDNDIPMNVLSIIP